MKENELKAVIFDIQAFSVHDGPGCRTTVFLLVVHCVANGVRTLRILRVNRI